MKINSNINIMKTFNIFMIIIIVFSFTFQNVVAKDVNLHLTTEAHPFDNYISLKWDMNDKSQPYSYQIKKRMNGQDESQSIPAKDTAKILNVYPEVPQKISYKTWDGTERIIDKSASAEMWIESPNSEHEKGYGMGLIDVDPIEIDDFNENPNEHLMENGEWKYDVIYFGGWDTNNWLDLSDLAVDVTREFIEDGRGVLFGHDTLDGIGNKNLNFGKLSEYANLKLFYKEEDIDSVPMLGSTLVENMKKGLLTQYPWNIESEKGLDIPYSHTGRQLAYGDIWLKFDKYEDPDYNSKPAWIGPEINHNGGTNNFYLTTWNNTAMIQTGHSNGEATPDEQKILANTLFYLSQVTTSNERKDTSGRDLASPDAPSEFNVKEVNGKVEIDFKKPNDNGTLYEYQVEATGRNDGEKILSNIVSETITSDLKGYSYIIDNNKDTKPTGVINTTKNNIKYDGNMNVETYLHIAAIDNAGNKSETTHINLSKFVDKVPPSLEIIKNPEEWINDKVNLNVKAVDEHSGIKTTFVTGSNFIKNGDFKDGELNWVRTAGGVKDWILNDGIVRFENKDGKEKDLIKLGQYLNHEPGIEGNYKVLINAKGEGNLNVRFGVGGTNNLPMSNEVYVNSKEFQDYELLLPIGNYSSESIIIELKGAGDVYLNEINIYETSEIKENNLIIYENGLYIITAVDNSNNMTSKEIIVNNIDKMKPEISLSQTPEEWTNQNVIIKAEAYDKDSGVRNLKYIGENMIKDSSFDEGPKYWDAGGAGGNVIVNKGSAILKDNTVIRNKLRQLGAFKGSEVGAEYFAIVTARGEGVINARYAHDDGGVADSRFEQELISSEQFLEYTFPIIRKEDSNDSFHVEKVGREGWIEITNVEVYAQKELNDNNTLEVSNNGKFTFIAEDYANNVSSKVHKVTNIDKENPTINIIQNIYETTHENVLLNVKASDSLSGIKRVTLLGENMIYNGDFLNGKEGWTNREDTLGDLTEGKIEMRDGNILLQSKVKLNKAKQEDAFKGSVVGAEYYAEITARGEGKLNARYGATNGNMQNNHTKTISDKENFKIYRFKMERSEGNNDQFIMEKVDPSGWIEIKDVKVFAQMEIKEEEVVEITKNGEYTFIAEDNAGNIANKKHNVTNIVKELSFTNPSINNNIEAEINEEMKVELEVSNIKITDWRDDVKNNWKLTVESNQIYGDKLPIGTVSLKGIDKVIYDNPGSDPSVSYISNDTIIDSGPAAVSIGSDARGEYLLIFKKNALMFNFKNNEIKRGDYGYVIVWSIESSPTF